MMDGYIVVAMIVFAFFILGYATSGKRGEETPMTVGITLVLLIVALALIVDALCLDSAIWKLLFGQ